MRTSGMKRENAIREVFLISKLGSGYRRTNFGPVKAMPRNQERDSMPWSQCGRLNKEIGASAADILGIPDSRFSNSLFPIPFWPGWATPTWRRRDSHRRRPYGGPGFVNSRKANLSLLPSAFPKRRLRLRSPTRSPLQMQFSNLLSPNKALQPTITSVTPPAGAGVAPAALVAHL